MKQGIECRNEGTARAIGRRPIRRIAGAGLLAALCAATLIAGQFTDPADGKKKKKKFNVVGKYQGTTEDDGTVSFRLTRGGKIVGFALTNATLYCVTQPTSFPTRNPEYTKVVTITHGPIRMQGKSKKWPQGKKFRVAAPLPENAAYQGGLFTGKLVDLLSSPSGGKVLPGKGMMGEVSYGSANGPTPSDATEWPPGTELCASEFIDWKAKKPGTPGFFLDTHPPSS